MKKKPTERDIDKELADSFPASDPPSWNPGSATKTRDDEALERARSKNTPPKK